jgi:hypothetical protein
MCVPIRFVFIEEEEVSQVGRYGRLKEVGHRREGNDRVGVESTGQEKCAPFLLPPDSVLPRPSPVVKSKRVSHGLGFRVSWNSLTGQ